MFIRLIIHSLIVIVLTLVTQLGGLAWLISMRYKHRFIIFLSAYTLLSITSFWIAPSFGRVPLSCTSHEAYVMKSWLFCALNRHYVTPEMYVAVQDLSTHMDQKFTGTKVVILDGNFPYFDGFPLLPHLSHNDGRKLDLAFFYADSQGNYLPMQTRSPIGYFAFEEGEMDCPQSNITLRWNFVWLQSYWKNYKLDTERMEEALDWLSRDKRISKVFIEPHLKARFAPDSRKIRFQGCRAARHDDHIHIQL